MSNWTEEYLWDRQEAEQRSNEAMKNSPMGKLAYSLCEYYISKKSTYTKDDCPLIKELNRVKEELGIDNKGK